MFLRFTLTFLKLTILVLCRNISNLARSHFSQSEEWYTLYYMLYWYYNGRWALTENETKSNALHIVFENKKTFALLHLSLTLHSSKEKYNPQGHAKARD